MQNNINKKNALINMINETNNLLKNMLVFPPTSEDLKLIEAGIKKSTNKSIIHAFLTQNVSKINDVLSNFQDIDYQYTLIKIINKMLTKKQIIESNFFGECTKFYLAFNKMKKINMLEFLLYYNRKNCNRIQGCRFKEFLFRDIKIHDGIVFFNTNGIKIYENSNIIIIQESSIKNIKWINEYSIEIEAKENKIVKIIFEENSFDQDIKNKLEKFNENNVKNFDQDIKNKLEEFNENENNAKNFDQDIKNKLEKFNENENNVKIFNQDIKNKLEKINFNKNNVQIYKQPIKNKLEKINFNENNFINNRLPNNNITFTNAKNEFNKEKNVKINNNNLITDSLVTVNLLNNSQIDRNDLEKINKIIDNINFESLTNNENSTYNHDNLYKNVKKNGSLIYNKIDNKKLKNKENQINNETMENEVNLNIDHYRNNNNIIKNICKYNKNIFDNLKADTKILNNNKIKKKKVKFNLDKKFNQNISNSITSQDCKNSKKYSDNSQNPEEMNRYGISEIYSDNIRNSNEILRDKSRMNNSDTIESSIIKRNENNSDNRENSISRDKISDNNFNNRKSLIVKDKNKKRYKQKSKQKYKKKNIKDCTKVTSKLKNVKIEKIIKVLDELYKLKINLYKSYYLKQKHEAQKFTKKVIKAIKDEILNDKIKIDKLYH